MSNKQNTIDHKFLANMQRRRKWSGDSPLALHIQHHSTIQICRLPRLSIVNLSLACRPNKESDSRWDLSFQMLFHGKTQVEQEERKHPIKGINLEKTTTTGEPTNTVCLVPINLSWIKKTKTILKRHQFPVMNWSSETNIPMSNPILPAQKISHQSILILSYTKQ